MISLQKKYKFIPVKAKLLRGFFLRHGDGFFASHFNKHGSSRYRQKTVEYLFRSEA